MVFHRRRWILDPFEEMRRMREWTEQMFGETPETAGLLPAVVGEEAGRTAVPAVDLVDKDDKLLLKADMPGISKDDIKVEIKGDRVEISAETKEERQKRKKKGTSGESDHMRAITDRFRFQQRLTAKRSTQASRTEFSQSRCRRSKQQRSNESRSNNPTHPISPFFILGGVNGMYNP